MEEGKLTPIFEEALCDLETPTSLFLKLRPSTPSFLLESVEGGERLGRYSFIGINPYLVAYTQGKKGFILKEGKLSKVRVRSGDPLNLISDILDRSPIERAPNLPPFFGGAVGYLSYDVVSSFERIPLLKDDELGLPDSYFMFADIVIAFDHVQNRVKVIFLPHSLSDIEGTYKRAEEEISKIWDKISCSYSPSLKPISQETFPFTCNSTQEEFCTKVKRIKEYILAGDAFQVVLSQRLKHKTLASPFSIYRALRVLNPSPYMFYLNLGDFQIIGSSPEMLVKLEGKVAETRPIAGTRPRIKGDEEMVVTELLSDPKERSEHVMLVDLGRNDLGRVCRYGTVKVPLFMGIEKYSHVIHIVSQVQGELQKGCSAFDLLRSCFPAGTVTGAPKIRAMEIVSELEGSRRGPYAGAVGYFGFEGNMDTCITIRTIVMKGDMAYLQGGAGIVADSDPYREYEESLNKIEVLKNAISLAEGGGNDKMGHL
jgi:anthranilate synthase component 1